MKNFLSALLISSLTITSSFAGTTSYVEKDVAPLGDLAMGYSFEKVEGKDADEMLVNYLELNGSEDAPVFKEFEDMNDGDEIDEGFTSMKSALKMNQFAMSQIDGPLEGTDNDAETVKLKAKYFDLDKKWAPIIKRLDRQGVKFGYSGNGPGYCGVSFIKLLIIDEKEGKVYDVYLSESGSC